MAYFLLFVDLQGQKGLIVGGGSVAAHKVKILMDYGPKLILAAPEIEAEVEALGDRIEIRRRRFIPEDLEGCGFAVAASDDQEVNRRVASLCREQKIPVNVVDVKEECTFLFPALVKRGDVTVGISTGGSSPAAAGMLKEIIGEAVPEGAGEVVRRLGSYRVYVKERVDSLPVRMAVFRELAVMALKEKAEVTDELVNQLIRKETEAGRGKEM